MKKLAYIAFTFILVMTGCTEDYNLEDNGFVLEELPAYVAFNPDGTSAVIPPFSVAEGDELDISVEVPGGTVSNVTVDYSFSGTAVYGTDFTVDGASASGGTLQIVLTTTPNQDGQPVNGDITVNFLTDDIVDGDKTLVIALTNASNAEGTLAVGRGGTEALSNVVVNIADADAP